MGILNKKVPRFKSIVVMASTEQLDAMLNSGWRVSHSFPHPEGVLVVLGKEYTNGQN
jgi:hypothetical protein